MENSQYELRRKELITLLQTYRDERHNVDRLTRLAREEADDELYPSSTDYTLPRVQTSVNEGKIAESTVIKACRARRHLNDTLKELENKTQLLDKLLCEISRLPAYQCRVIIGLYIDGHTENDIAVKMGKSIETICSYRRGAIRRLSRTVLGEKIRVWKSSEVKT